jgi:hypothetical protein
VIMRDGKCDVINVLARSHCVVAAYARESGWSRDGFRNNGLRDLCGFRYTARAPESLVAHSRFQSRNSQNYRNA